MGSGIAGNFCPGGPKHNTTYFTRLRKQLITTVGKYPLLQFFLVGFVNPDSLPWLWLLGGDPPGHLRPWTGATHLSGGGSAVEPPDPPAWLDDVGGATGVSESSFIVETTHDESTTLAHRYIYDEIRR